MKSDFIAIASHELRTPLGVILGYATFLREEAKGEAGEYATAVLDSAMHMRRLIEDMTNLRFMEVGQSPLAREPLDVRELLNDARKDITPLADAKAQKVAVQLPDLPVIVIADRAKILLVLSNLLTNAGRYTQNGGVIEMRTYLKGNEAWVEVKDNGRGILPSDLERIFQGFFQAEDHMVRKTGGLGIGLSIVRGTIKQHGGRVWAESEGEGKGATFIFTLPLARAPGALPNTGPLPPRPATTSPRPSTDPLLKQLGSGSPKVRPITSQILKKLGSGSSPNAGALPAGPGTKPLPPSPGSDPNKKDG
jgi:signal transduction histidine kinase